MLRMTPLEHVQIVGKIQSRFHLMVERNTFMMVREVED